MLELKVILTVNAPSRPGSGINALVTDTCRITGTCLCTGTAVDANLEAQVMNLVCKARDAIRESVRIGNQLVRLSVAATLHRPAIVEIDIFITGILQK